MPYCLVWLRKCRHYESAGTTEEDFEDPVVYLLVGQGSVCFWLVVVGEVLGLVE